MRGVGGKNPNRFSMDKTKDACLKICAGHYVSVNVLVQKDEMGKKNANNVSETDLHGVVCNKNAGVKTNHTSWVKEKSYTANRADFTIHDKAARLIVGGVERWDVEWRAEEEEEEE